MVIMDSSGDDSGEKVVLTPSASCDGGSGVLGSQLAASPPLLVPKTRVGAAETSPVRSRYKYGLKFPALAAMLWENKSKSRCLCGCGSTPPGRLCSEMLLLFSIIYLYSQISNANLVNCIAY